MKEGQPKPIPERGFPRKSELPMRSIDALRMRRTLLMGEILEINRMIAHIERPDVLPVNARLEISVKWVTDEEKPSEDR